MTHAAQYDEQWSEAIKARDAMEELLNQSLGWAIINEWLLEEIRKLRDTYETSGPTEDPRKFEYLRAQLNMLRTLQELPTAILQGAIDALEAMKVHNEGDE